MNFGADAPNSANGLAPYVINAATGTRDGLVEMGVTSAVGITVMIGESDIASESFSKADAQALTDFVESAPWVRLVSYSTINHDTSENVAGGVSQYKYEFLEVFKKAASNAGMISW